MYIEFDLSNQDYYYARKAIERTMVQWHRRFDIAYRIKPIKLKLRITFDHEESYSFWAMTWNPKQHAILAQYCIVSDLNNKI